MDSERLVAIVGMGELGGVFARGLLKSGISVRPVRRGDSLSTVAGAKLALVCVGESELDLVLSGIGADTPIGLVQNELLPSSWERFTADDPTVAIVWFEKKAGRDVHQVRPTGIYGPQAKLLLDALKALEIDAYEVGAADLEFELVLKNLYILSLNTIGLVCPGSVGAVWDTHRARMSAVVEDVVRIQLRLVESRLDEARLIQGLNAAIQSDPAHGCLGRTARTRLARALSQADALGIDAPALLSVASECRLER